MDDVLNFFVNSLIVCFHLSTFSFTDYDTYFEIVDLNSGFYSVSNASFRTLIDSVLNDWTADINYAVDDVNYEYLCVGVRNFSMSYITNSVSWILSNGNYLNLSVTQHIKVDVVDVHIRNWSIHVQYVKIGVLHNCEIFVVVVTCQMNYLTEVYRVLVCSETSFTDLSENSLIVFFLFYNHYKIYIKFFCGFRVPISNPYTNLYSYVLFDVWEIASHLDYECYFEICDTFWDYLDNYFWYFFTTHYLILYVSVNLLILCGSNYTLEFNTVTSVRNTFFNPSNDTLKFWNEV